MTCTTMTLAALLLIALRVASLVALSRHLNR